MRRLRKMLIAAVFAVILGTLGSASAGQHYSVGGYTISIDGGHVTVGPSH